MLPAASVVVLAASSLLAGDVPETIAATADRIVAAPVVVEVPPEPLQPPSPCRSGCQSLEPRNDDKPLGGGWTARGTGAVLGLSLGYAFGNEAKAPGGNRLRGWRSADTVLAGVTVAAWATTRLVDRAPKSGPSSEAFGCGHLDALDQHVADALGGKKWRQNAARLSDLTLTAASALPVGLALGANSEARGLELAVSAGTLAVDLAFADVVKRLVHRPRPYARFCRPYTPPDLEEDDAHYSFYSGHSSTAFSMAVTGGMLSHYRGSRNEGWVWATGLTLATTTGVLRIAADKHYFTDVLAGAAAGSFVGWLVPRLHKPAASPRTLAMADDLGPGFAVPVALPNGALRVRFGRGFALDLSARW